MAFMQSGVVDMDGKPILASCPIYHKNPLCVNSCALFVPLIHEVDGKEIVDFNYGYCGLVNGVGQILAAVTMGEEKKMRKKYRIDDD